MVQVSVKDFGPIIEGTVELKPLTIFVGPSNAGKSYMAMLVYSLMQSLDPSPSFYIEGMLDNKFHSFRRFFRNEIIRHDDIEIDDHTSEAITDWIRDMRSRDSIASEVPGSIEFSFEDLSQEIRALVERSVNVSLQATERLFGRELQRYHGKVDDLRNRRGSDAHLKVRIEQIQPLLRLHFEVSDGEFCAMPDSEWDLSGTKFHLPIRLFDETQKEIDRSITQPTEIDNFRQNNLILLLVQSALGALMGEFPGNSYYLPAARSGIAQGHKAIASILVRQSSMAGIQPFEIPTLSGIITDFMGHILLMERARTTPLMSNSKKVAKVVEFLENEVVKGRIDIEASGQVTYPEIVYAPSLGQPSMGSLPFHRTSSMVSELAPVILFLKYLVEPRDLVILEEPESHLHPATQRQMARGIARLVNAGVKVIITTHSDYFISQVNNLLNVSRASKQKRAKEGFVAADCLNPDDVAAYNFKLRDDLGGSVVEELSIIPGYGIDEQEFAGVTEALYEETVALQRIRAN